DISRQDVIEASGCGAGAITALIDKGVFQTQKKAVSRFAGTDIVVEKDFVLDERQSLALVQIREYFTHKEVVLLHGVTASGKTQLYIRLIEEALHRGESVLYL